ncbi:MAG: C39 family peptidase [Telluria sp.]
MWRAACLLVSLPCCLPPCAAAEFAAAGAVHVPVVSIAQLRYAATVHQQFDFSCGSAALATLLSYHYGVAVTEQQVFARMWQDGDQAAIRQAGFSLLDMQRYLATLGLRADGFAQPLDRLAAAGWPAIVLVSDGGFRHFVVVKGLEGGRVLVGDSARGTRALARADFERLWVNRLLFVIHGFRGPVRFNDPADWRAAPPAPLAATLDRRGLDPLDLSKHGPGGF